MRGTQTLPLAEDTENKIPEFWDRSVVFFANLLALFFGNEKQAKELADEVGEVDTYGGRVIPILNLIYRGGNNVLVLERTPDYSLCRYFENALGLDLPKVEILHHADFVDLPRNGERWTRERLRNSSQWVDGYVTDKTLAAWASKSGKRTVSTHEGSHCGNNKRLLHERLMQENLPIPRTIIASDSSEACEGLLSLQSEGFRWSAVRSALGASGIGMIKVDLASPIGTQEIPDHFFHEGPCLVQGWLEPGYDGITRVESPSVQLFLDEEAIHMFDITEQILSEESVHEGNMSPPRYLTPTLRAEVIRQAYVAGTWLHEQGYRGTASADFIVTDSGADKEPTVYVCEVNARITGATYPSVLARHFLPKGAWLMRNLRLETPIEGEKLLSMLETANLLFLKSSGKGVLPINFNLEKDGLVSKGQFLCLANSVDHCIELLDMARERLPTASRTDRD